MNTPRKFVSPLDKEQTVSLKYITANGSSARVRMRAQSILLSSKGYSIDETADIADVYRNTVSSWIENWEENGFESLHDKPRSGAPSKLTEPEIETVKKIISEHPRSPKMITANILEQINKTVSISTLKRIIKKANLRWKRVRKSVKNKRNEKESEKAEKEIKNLKQEQDFGLIDLFCFDESGFSLCSQIPYAYQPAGETAEINSSHSKILNILSFLNTANQFECFSFECSIDSEIVVRCFNEFSEIITKKLLLSSIIPLCISVRNSGKT